MGALIEENFTCMLCGKGFADSVLERTDNLKQQDTDFRIYAEGMQPLSYLVHACPFCGFADYKHDEKLTEDERVKLSEYLQTVCRETGAGGASDINQYEMLSEIFIMRRMPSMEIADAYMKAGWAADDEGNADKSILYKEKALQYIVQALEREEVPPVEQPVATYLAGELNRRLSRFDEALLWFSRVSTQDTQLERLCRQQAAMAEGRQAENAHIPTA